MHTKAGYKCCDKYTGETDEVKTISGKHYAKAICKYCHHFLKWLPNPNITEEVKKRNETIDKCISNEKITEKQKTFLEDIKKSRFLTPKQLSYLNSIYVKCL